MQGQHVIIGPSMSDAVAARAEFKKRHANHGIQDPRVKSLERWVARVKDDTRVVEAIEMVSLVLDSPRRTRWELSRIIDDHLRTPERIFPHDDRMAFLRWIVRTRETTAKIDAKLAEIRDAKTDKARAEIIAGLSEHDEGGTEGSIENAHSILAHAWRAAPPDARPRHDAHRGEAEAFIGAMGTIRLAMFLARRVEHLVTDAAEKKRFAGMLKDVAAAADGKPVTERLKTAAKETKLTGALGIARSACAEAKAVRGRPDMAGSAARPAAVKVVGLVLEAEGKEAVRGFLSALDDELRRLDVVHAMTLKKKTSTSPIKRAVYRGQGVWLAELDENASKFGLLVKQGARWQWLEGEPKDILAMIPDAHFEKAVMAAK